MLLNYHYIIKNKILDSSWTPFGLMLLNYHYIIIFCSRWWLPVGIAGFRLELQAFRLELPLRVVFAGFSVGIVAPGGFCRRFGWNCRSSAEKPQTEPWEIPKTLSLGVPGETLSPETPQKR